MIENRVPPNSESPENKERIKKLRIEFGEFGIPKEGRPTSEDAIFASKEDLLFAIFDGVGGHSAGEVASSMAKENLERNSKAIEISNERKAVHPQQIAEQLSAKLVDADFQIYKEATEDPSKRKMGTTASVVKLFENPEGKMFAIIANAGDSRVYMLSAGKLKKLTRDDHALKALGVPPEEIKHLEEKLDRVKSINDLSGVEVAAFKTRNTISNYLGREDGAVVRTDIIELSAGDKIIITSDGIHDNLTTEEIEAIANEDLPAKSISTRLVRAARDRSEELDPETGEKHLRAKRDDMSTVVIEIEPKPRATPIEDEITQKIVRI